MNRLRYVCHLCIPELSFAEPLDQMVGKVLSNCNIEHRMNQIPKQAHTKMTGQQSDQMMKMTGRQGDQTKMTVLVIFIAILDRLYYIYASIINWYCWSIIKCKFSNSFSNTREMIITDKNFFTGPIIIRAKSYLGPSNILLVGSMALRYRPYRFRRPWRCNMYMK